MKCLILTWLFFLSESWCELSSEQSSKQRWRWWWWWWKPWVSSWRLDCSLSFSISTSPIIHIACPPKFCISIVLSFCYLFWVLPNFCECFYLTIRFYVAVHLSSNRSQMMSKCGKNKKVAHEVIAECVTDVLTTFWRHLWSITGQMHSNMESICFI